MSLGFLQRPKPKQKRTKINFQIFVFSVRPIIHTLKHFLVRTQQMQIIFSMQNNLFYLLTFFWFSCFHLVSCSHIFVVNFRVKMSIKRRQKVQTLCCGNSILLLPLLPSLSDEAGDHCNHFYDPCAANLWVTLAQISELIFCISHPSLIMICWVSYSG